MRTRIPQRIGLAVAGTVLVTSCGGGLAADAPASEATAMSESVMAEPVMAEPAETPTVAAPLPDDGAAIAHARERCLTAIPIFDRRVEVEGWPYEDEEEELSDEEIERTIAPAIDFTDGVAGADERPEIAPMPAFDVEAVDLVQLDRFVEACFEHGIVTEEEVWGDDD